MSLNTKCFNTLVPMDSNLFSENGDTKSWPKLRIAILNYFSPNLFVCKSVLIWFTTMLFENGNYHLHEFCKAF
jgi:hypothetical protein